MLQIKKNNLIAKIKMIFFSKHSSLLVSNLLSFLTHFW